MNETVEAKVKALQLVLDFMLDETKQTDA